MDKVDELKEFVKSLASSVDELTTEVFILKQEMAKIKQDIN